MGTANVNPSREFASRDSRLFHLDAPTLRVDILGSSSFSSPWLHGNCFGCRPAAWLTNISTAWTSLGREWESCGRSWQRADLSRSACAWRRNICFLSQLTHLLPVPS